MEYAITAKEIGHDVVVLEKGPALGGAMDWAGNYPNLPNMEMLRYQPDYHRVMMKKWGVGVRLNTEATKASVLAERPDVVVIATGAEAILPDVDGFAAARKSGFAATIDQVLDRHAPAKIGKSVIVWGAGEGAELAANLKRGGHEVRLLDAYPHYVPANYIGSRMYAIMGLLAVSGVAIENGFTLTGLDDGVAIFAKADGSTEKLRADTIIVCQGRKAADSLARELQSEKLTLHVIGDARKPRSYANAIHEAAYLSRQI
jgi:NADPH-dependent 2,4-dienoyl-CoA reductase/sulfur reductase-like enzyme